MATDLTPDEIRRAEFRTVLRGLNASQVSEFLETVAGQIERLVEERERLQARLGEMADRDLRTEFDQIGREVSAVLEAARDAAESMRERAALDAARWRSEAMVETEALRKQAKSDAEALRGDAWATGTELLAQAMAEVASIRKEAERDSLTITGEAEREAHRLVSTSRREAEDLVRGATMDAEKITSEAVKRRDDLIEQAHRQSAAAEERTLALEARREELLEELENVRSTLSRLEGTLEERRDEMDLSKSPTSSVRVVSGSPPSDPKNWALGETVRVVETDLSIPPSVVVIQPEKKSPAPPPPPTVAEEEIPDEPPATLEEPEETALEEPETMAAEASAESSAETPATATLDAPTDDVGALFASLRQELPHGGDVPVEDPAGGVEPSAPADITTKRRPGPEVGQVWVEDRDSRLLPIANRGLRGVKKAVTDAQNVALDSLRTDGDWVPDAILLSEGMRADLIGLWAESYSAGHSAAEEMLGERLKRPVTPHSDAADEFGEALAEAVSEALVAAGDGQRERQSATSRVFRGWRTDEAERRIRQLAHRGYHQGIVESSPSATVSWVAAGTMCSACTQASADPRSSPPPVHAGCECTVVIS